MFLKKNIWLIFYVLLFLGILFLAQSIYSVWNNLQNKTSEELSYLNKVFSSSVRSTFDQQEIMLELLGQQLLNNKQYVYQAQTRQILDRLLKQNRSLIGFALSNIEGQLIAGSSNIVLEKMPNLKQDEKSRETFNKALDSSDLVLGHTYFLDVIKDWVIPMRKAIRDQDNQLLGVMIAGAKPTQLFARLNDIQMGDSQISYQLMLIHDESYNYAYLSGLSQPEQLAKLVEQPVPLTIIEQHDRAMKKQLGTSIAELRQNLQSAEYFAPSVDGNVQLVSTIYLPKYHMWSVTFIPRSRLFEQVISASMNYLLSFVIAFLIVFLLFRYIYQFEKNNRKLLLDQANHDFLTGLNNRLYLQYVEKEWVFKNAPPFSVMFLDLDNFKNINDSYGHTFGDDILKQVSQRLRGVFSENNLICRQGGDEFIILCKTTDLERLEQQAEKLLTEISQPYQLDPYQFVIGASIGISRYPQNGDSFDSLFSAADTAMYQAKQKKNNYFVFTNELQQQIIQTSKIEQALHSALSNQEFSLVYQPQINARGALYGVEALVRWHHPELGMVPPNQFIPTAEDSGLIIELGHFIMEQAIKDMVELEPLHDHFDLQLSLNISVRQFLEKGFEEKLNDLMKKYKFPSRLLTLEITESIFIDDYDYIGPLLERIKSFGIKFSMDDFGTGFSSLSMLSKLPIDELKIDKSFIDDMTSNAQDKAMVLNIINIAKNLGLQVVAEGIETEQQSKMLKNYLCDIQQGYYHSKPMSFDLLRKYCRET